MVGLSHHGMRQQFVGTAFGVSIAGDCCMQQQKGTGHLHLQAPVGITCNSWHKRNLCRMNDVLLQCSPLVIGQQADFGVSMRVWHYSRRVQSVTMSGGRQHHKTKGCTMALGISRAAVGHYDTGTDVGYMFFTENP